MKPIAHGKLGYFLTIAPTALSQQKIEMRIFQGKLLKRLRFYCVSISGDMYRTCDIDRAGTFNGIWHCRAAVVARAYHRAATIRHAYGKNHHTTFQEQTPLDVSAGPVRFLSVDSLDIACS